MTTTQHDLLLDQALNEILAGHPNGKASQLDVDLLSLLPLAHDLRLAMAEVPPPPHGLRPGRSAFLSAAAATKPRRRLSWPGLPGLLRVWQGTAPMIAVLLLALLLAFGLRNRVVPAGPSAPTPPVGTQAAPSPAAPLMIPALTRVPSATPTLTPTLTPTQTPTTPPTASPTPQPTAPPTPLPTATPTSQTAIIAPAVPSPTPQPTATPLPPSPTPQPPQPTPLLPTATPLPPTPTPIPPTATRVPPPTSTPTAVPPTPIATRPPQVTPTVQIDLTPAVASPTPTATSTPPIRPRPWPTTTPGLTPEPPSTPLPY